MKIIIILLAIGTIFAQESNLDWRSNTELFDSMKSKHFLVYWLKSNYDTKTIHFLVSEREEGYNKIQKYFKLSDDLSVNLYLFPDQETKYKITKHKGVGWGFDNNIVEVLNDSVELDPYHELIHIFIYSLGKPNTMIDEGIAVYLSHEFGGTYFQKLLGYPNKSLIEIYKDMIRNTEELDLLALFNQKDIQESKNVPFAYVTSAMIVGDLLNKYGKWKLIEYLKLCKNTTVNKNEIFEKVYNITFNDFLIEFNNKFK